jgi:hypothetical protein
MEAAKTNGAELSTGASEVVVDSRPNEPHHTEHKRMIMAKLAEL